MKIIWITGFKNRFVGFVVKFAVFFYKIVHYCSFRS
jgi:hypothetical protein